MSLPVYSLFSPSVPATVLDVTRFGAVADGTTDDSAAVTAAIAAAPVSDNTWGDSRRSRMTVIFFPATDDCYRLASEVEIPSNKSIWLIGAGSHGSRICADGNYAFYRRAAAGAFHAFMVSDMLFDACGVRVEDQSRNWHTFERLFFKDAPVAGIYLEDDGLGEGGIVGGLISNCEFENGAQGIVCIGQNSDNWTVTACQFTRQSSSDIEIKSSGWSVSNCHFEQRRTNANRPHIHMHGNVFDIEVDKCRFGAEVSGSNEPPRECVLVGAVDTAEAATVETISITGCFFDGRNGGATATSADSAIRFNAGVRALHVSGNFYSDYNTSLLNLQHGNLGDGERNEVIVPNPWPSQAQATPLFNRSVSRGPAGSFKVSDGSELMDDSGRAVTALLSTALTAWTLNNVTVAMTATGPDGAANSAFTITKAATGTGDISNNPTAANGTDPVYFECWVRGGGGISVVRLGLTPLHGVMVETPLTSAWRKVGFWMDAFPSSTPTLYVGAGAVGTTETGTIEITQPVYAQGRLPR